MPAALTWTDGGFNRVADQREACHIPPALAIQRYVSDTSELGGAQRLAVFAVDFGRQRPGAFAEPNVCSAAMRAGARGAAKAVFAGLSRP